MGMYDHVTYECICPRCHNKVDGFQSKDGPCVLSTLAPEEVDNFYTSCNCGAWIEFHVAEDSKRRHPEGTKFKMLPLKKPK